MKKIIMYLLAVIILIVVGVYAARNIIVKNILEKKLTEINKGKVDIGKVEFSPFNKRIVVRDIEATSQRNSMKNFVTVKEFNADYDIYISDKKVLISEAHIINVDFLTDRKTDGAIGIKEKTPLDASQVLVPDDEEKNKEVLVTEIENSYLDNMKINDLNLENILKSEYERNNKLLEEKRNYWETRIKEIEKGKEFKSIREDLKKVTSLKNPLDIFKMDREVKNIIDSAKVLNDQLKDEKEQIRLDLEDMKNSPELKFSVEKSVEAFVQNGEIAIKDLDSLVNIYLNEVYEKKIYEIVVKYRDVLKEIELRKNEDMGQTDKWEVYVEKIDLTSTLYGFALNGELNNISSRLSRNEDNVTFFLNGDKKDSHGKMDGYFNVNTLEGYINIDISKVDLEELKEFNDYILGGSAGLSQKTVLSKNDIVIKGKLNMRNLDLNGQKITDSLNIKVPLLKDMIIPLLSDVKDGDISYNYNSNTRRVTVKSNLSEKILKVLNNKDGYWKKKIIEDMKKNSEKEIAKYEEILKAKEEEIRKKSEDGLEIQMNELSKIEEQINFLKSKNKKDILNELFKRF
ncbi:MULTISPECIES: hypothetical protein [Fusobacterium]|jgi:hypothetical protein|uniref:TIGR03545 family protein n=1 Tax=Fusobacterium ulcerans TaxID=861 RepID=A0AAX1TP12_9FUSO|nr:MULTISPECIES: hypothetical protein [Fusobacterium]AVQ26967.1 hypothetical protein C4N20_02315 [Fusobacterium ulcerans]EFS24905.2 hypothetical protein FUAG_00420 [Fusobacterium ulcerans ATCC 49185]MCB8565920.1 DUF748 domain-containing protein [Fusobacterium ulcerans]MCB8649974.1 DUF748 domain-containing protein [Fusobacterium ulcerans]MDH6456616.1 hypothetical protein [Fusobacterium sp. PH5-7]